MEHAPRCEAMAPIWALAGGIFSDDGGGDGSGSTDGKEGEGEEKKKTTRKRVEREEGEEEGEESAEDREQRERRAEEARLAQELGELFGLLPADVAGLIFDMVIRPSETPLEPAGPEALNVRLVSHRWRALVNRVNWMHTVENMLDRVPPNPMLGYRVLEGGTLLVPPEGQEKRQQIPIMSMRQWMRRYNILHGFFNYEAYRREAVRLDTVRQGCILRGIPIPKESIPDIDDTLLSFLGRRGLDLRLSTDNDFLRNLDAFLLYSMYQQHVDNVHIFRRHDVKVETRDFSIYCPYYDGFLRQVSNTEGHFFVTLSLRWSGFPTNAPYPHHWFPPEFATMDRQGGEVAPFNALAPNPERDLYMILTTIGVKNVCPNLTMTGIAQRAIRDLDMRESPNLSSASWDYLSRMPNCIKFSFRSHFADIVYADMLKLPILPRGREERGPHPGQVRRGGRLFDVLHRQLPNVGRGFQWFIHCPNLKTLTFLPSSSMDDDDDDDDDKKNEMHVRADLSYFELLMGYKTPEIYLESMSSPITPYGFDDTAKRAIFRDKLRERQEGGRRIPSRLYLGMSESDYITDILNTDTVWWIFTLHFLLQMDRDARVKWAVQEDEMIKDAIPAEEIRAARREMIAMNVTHRVMDAFERNQLAELLMSIEYAVEDEYQKMTEQFPGKLTPNDILSFQVWSRKGWKGSTVRYPDEGIAKFPDETFTQEMMAMHVARQRRGDDQVSPVEWVELVQSWAISIEHIMTRVRAEGAGGIALYIRQYAYMIQENRHLLLTATHGKEYYIVQLQCPTYFGCFPPENVPHLVQLIQSVDTHAARNVGQFPPTLKLWLKLEKCHTLPPFMFAAAVSKTGARINRMDISSRRQGEGLPSRAFVMPKSMMYHPTLLDVSIEAGHVMPEISWFMQRGIQWELFRPYNDDENEYYHDFAQLDLKYHTGGARLMSSIPRLRFDHMAHCRVRLIGTVNP